MRMILETVMVLALVGGLLFVTKVLAKENREEKNSPGNGDVHEEAAGKSIAPDTEK